LAGVILSTVLTIPGSGVLLYGAAISALPADVFEAARIDGAGRWVLWRRILFPLLRPTTLYLSVIYTIASFQVFERVYMMTGGGPAGSTAVVVEQIHASAFLRFDFGAASAQSVILLIMIAAVAWGQFAALRDDLQY
jgi:multiple sugar transport system permease protein